VLEGIDGSGKSEQTQRLADWLRGLSFSVLQTREPTDGPWGLRYRAWAVGELEATPDEVLDFFVRDRRDHVTLQIAPALEAGEIVVCDRYVASTIAYQTAQGISRDRLIKDCAEFPPPGLTLWLRLPIEQALGRIQSRGPEERFERAAFLERVDQEYARMALEVIDASGSPETVAADIQRRVRALMGM
jgi:dTMP kinase